MAEPPQNLRPTLEHLAARRLAPLALGLGIFYALLTIAHCIFLSTPAQKIMVPVAVVSVCFFFCCRLFLKIGSLRLKHAHAFVFSIGLVVLANCLAHLVADPDPKHSTNLAMALIGGGLLFLSRPWFLSYIAIGLAGWAVLIPQFAADSDLVHYGFMIGSAVVLSIMVFTVRQGGLAELESSRALSAEIERRRKAEEQERLMQGRLFHADKMSSLGVLAAGLAHDINNVVACITVSAELGVRSLGSEEARRRFKEIGIAADRASRITNEMLAFSGKNPADKGPLDLSVVARQVDSLLSASIARVVDIHLTLAPESHAMVHGDSSQIEQVAVNLLINAVEALGQDGGRVVVSTGTTKAVDEPVGSLFVESKLEHGRYAFLSVADMGIGISPDELTKIFDPFYSTKFTGRGLGLASVAGIARAHGGAIRVESEAGHGSTFTLLLPLIEPPPAPPRSAEARSAAWDPRGLRAFVVDDEPVLADLTATVLTQAGFEVEVCYGGPEALAKLQRSPDLPDVFLVDATMPELAGRELIRRIRQIEADVPAILLSGYDASSLEDQTEVVPDAFVAKPFTSRRLLNVVRRVIEQHARKR